MRQPFPISLVRIFRLESQSSYVVKQFIHSTADTQYNDLIRQINRPVRARAGVRKVATGASFGVMYMAFTISR